MSTVIVTGAQGLIGSESCTHFAGLGHQIVGVDNDMRRHFFGEEASTAPVGARLAAELGGAYSHVALDIRDRDGIDGLFRTHGDELSLVIHAAAQPSHDWAAGEPLVDFDINATGTLNLLEATRRHAPEATFIFCSTNKVYGDRPNDLPLRELDTRYELPEDHPYFAGIPEQMPIDTCLHSLFGASKLAADVLTQEYGRYYGLPTGVFRGGTLTGPAHAATELHGFLGYLMRCAVSGTEYVINGYQGKQVRDAIHSRDLVRAFEHYAAAPRVGEVYNIGGGRESNVSILEAIELCERITGRSVAHSYREESRVGDHIWWIGSNERFRSHYPEWTIEYTIEGILEDIYEGSDARLGA
jgi:CDP-paratose 2-epimerase